jgi:hypothetical protein
MIMTDEMKQRFFEKCSEIDTYCDFIESVQAEIVRAGGCFKSRFEIEKMTLKEINEICTPNCLKLKWCGGKDE